MTCDKKLTGPEMNEVILPTFLMYKHSQVKWCRNSWSGDIQWGGNRSGLSCVFAILATQWNIPADYCARKLDRYILYWKTKLTDHVVSVVDRQLECLIIFSNISWCPWCGKPKDGVLGAVSSVLTTTSRVIHVIFLPACSCNVTSQVSTNTFHSNNLLLQLSRRVSHPSDNLTLFSQWVGEAYDPTLVRNTQMGAFMDRHLYR